MSTLPILTYYIILCFFTLYFKSLVADPSSSFSFKNFGQDSSFNSVLALYGDAKVANNGSCLQLTGSSQSGAGRVVYKNPIKFYAGNPRKLVSFSTYFSFSVSGSGLGIGDGLAFVVFGNRYPVDLIDESGSFGIPIGGGFKFMSVEFDTLMDDKYNDMNGNHVGIDLNNFASLTVANLSSVNLGLNSSNRLQVWIDYESNSRRLEVRLNRFGESRPVEPLLFQKIDFPKIWPENEEFVVGLSSSNGNSTQVCNLYSWSFKTRRSPDWMHSKPLDPIGFNEGEEKEIKIHKKDDCVMRVLSALIVGIGLGALGSFVGMFLWALFATKRQVSPEEYAVKPVVDSKTDDKSFTK